MDSGRNRPSPSSIFTPVPPASGFADDTFVIFPQGKLGTGWFGTTPEQSDLMAGSAANVSITDVGVAVTTSKETDPVNVDTKVSMIYLPSFETADQVGIIDVTGA